jgi:hypothetical protein
VKLEEITGLKLSEAAGSVQTSPIACNIETQLLELRLDRGILQRKQCSATQIEGQFPAVRHSYAVDCNLRNFTWRQTPRNPGLQINAS